MPFSLDPVIAEARRRARQRRSLVLVAAIIAMAAGSVGLIRLFAAPGTPVAGRASVVRIVVLPWPGLQGGPSIIAAPTLGNAHTSGGFVRLRGVESLIPKALPKNPVQMCNGVGPKVTIWLRDGRVFAYGQCTLPASIERLSLALVKDARK